MKLLRADYVISGVVDEAIEEHFEFSILTEEDANKIAEITVPMLKEDGEINVFPENDDLFLTDINIWDITDEEYQVIKKFGLAFNIGEYSMLLGGILELQDNKEED